MRLGRLYRIVDSLLIAHLPEGAERVIKQLLLRVARRIMGKQRRLPSIESLLSAPGSGRTRRDDLPEWAACDLIATARTIEPLLSPTHFLTKKPELYVAPLHRVSAGRTYISIRRLLPDTFDTLLLVPWLKPGGADLGAIHLATACAKAMGQRVAVLATEPVDSPWASRLPPDVTFVAAGEALAELCQTTNEPTQVLARLIIQAKPARVHLVNSDLGWQTFCRHGAALREVSNLYASLFCDELDEHGVPAGFAVDYLRDAAPHLTRVIADNSASVKNWVSLLGLDPNLFSVARFPAPQPPSPRRQAGSPTKSILWASRLDRQKRPDTLLRIAKRATDFHFDVHGYALSGTAHPASRALSKLPNVVMHGPFEALSEIIRDDHLALVYTTAWDGLPLVILDAISLGIPVIAPDVGGISDLIPKEHLVIDPENADAYVAKMNLLHEDPATREAMLTEQSKNLAKYSWAGFRQDLSAIPGYDVRP